MGINLAIRLATKRIMPLVESLMHPERELSRGTGLKASCVIIPVKSSEVLKYFGNLCTCKNSAKNCILGVNHKFKLQLPF